MYASTALTSSFLVGDGCFLCSSTSFLSVLTEKASDTFQLNALVGNQTCRHGTTLYPNGPVVPVPCNISKWQDLQTAKETGFGPVVQRPMDWLSDRTITWRYGTSCLVHLERATTNVAHLHSRVNMLLLMNLATVPAFSDVISRFLFRIAPEGIGQYLKTEILSPENVHPYHATYLAEVLSMVNMRAFEGRRLKVKQILGTGSKAHGRVEFGGALAEATEDRPVCFQKALVPGILKVSSISLHEMSFKCCALAVLLKFVLAYSVFRHGTFTDGTSI